MGFAQLRLNRGSDLDRTITFDPTLPDMTGWTFTIVDMQPASLVGGITCTLLSGSARTARLFGAWSANWPAIGENNVVTFYIRPSGLEETLPIRIFVE